MEYRDVISKYAWEKFSHLSLEGKISRISAGMKQRFDL